MIADKKHRITGITIMTGLILSALLGIGNSIGNAELTVPPAGKYVQRSIEENVEIEPFIRIDRDDPMAYEQDLANLRIITEGAYALGKPKEKYGIAPDYVPDLTGLDTLNASASAQFNEWQFRRLADTLRAEAEGKELIVFDLRRENHAFLDGRPFSVYGLHNWSNEGLTAEQIMQNERLFFGALAGTEFQAFAKGSDHRGEMSSYELDSMMTEQDLVKSEGFVYKRIPVLDHTWPKPEEVDTFIDFIKYHDMDHIWLHFHCHAGSGRTGAFLVIYDKMKNPDVAIEDICVRQAMLGASYMLQTKASDDYKIPLYQEKVKRVTQFGQYVEENYDNNYSVSWSDWLLKQSKPDGAQ